MTKMKRILKVKKAVKIEDGKHNGVITKLVWRSRPYDYVDLNIVFENCGENIEIKAGFPAVVADNTKLGRLLTRFGKKFNHGETIDIELTLLNQNIIFETFTEINNKGSFAKVNTDSINLKGVTS